MIFLDTDTYTLHQRGHERVLERCRTASEVSAITIATEIEVLRGRYDAVFKAEDGAHLLRAQQALTVTLQHLAQFQVAPLNIAVATEFDRLLATKGLRRIGRGDLLIAAIALANKATLITRNRRDFQKVSGLRIENWAD